MYRLWFLVRAVIFMAVLIPGWIRAQQWGNLYYEDNGSFRTVIGVREFFMGPIVIPDSIHGKPVSAIGPHAFDQGRVTSLQIPASVETIHPYAFWGIRELASIVVAEDNVNYSSLDEVLYNKDQSEILRYPIKKDLSVFDVPSTVSIIGSFAFQNSKLTTIILPSKLMTIGTSAFWGSLNLTELAIPATVSIIGDEAFAACQSLTSFDFPKGFTELADGLFKYCVGLLSITIPEGVTSLGKDLFMHCESLSQVTLPSTLVEIGDGVYTAPT